MSSITWVELVFTIHFFYQSCTTVEGRAWCYGLTFIVLESHAIYMQYQLLYNKVSKRNHAPPNHYGIYVNYLGASLKDRGICNVLMVWLLFMIHRQMHILVHAINIHFVRHTQLLNMLLLRQENMSTCVYIAITFQIVPLHYHYFQIFLYQIPLHLPFKLNKVL